MTNARSAAELDARRGDRALSRAWSGGRTAERAGALNLSVPGDFEPHMEGIAEWFRALRGRVPHGERATPPPGPASQPPRSKTPPRVNPRR